MFIQLLAVPEVPRVILGQLSHLSLGVFICVLNDPAPF